MKKPTTPCPTCGREVSAALVSLRDDAEQLTCPGRPSQRPVPDVLALAVGLMQVIPSTFDSMAHDATKQRSLS